ncbi:flagellar filament capping protein FliD [Brevibacillus sp. SYSU BS000544]|uniref:flagellar filament capping protein FliD n=1 Tax=Brevibacillus sp. SYSU BS000544 TaxID=3416443 RepID=UPI003CE47F8F
MIGITPYTLTSQRHNQYNFQMYQASLKNPIYPLSSYSFQSLYMKQQSWSLETSAVLTKLMNEASSIRKEAEQFNAKQTKSPLHIRTVTSSNQQAVIATAQPKADMTNYKVEVTKLAKIQKNTGNQLSSSASSNLQGNQAFRLNVGGKEHTVSFYSFKEDSNHQTMSRMAKAINRDDIGVTARVIEDKEKGTSRLELSSNQTGVKQSFSIYDVEGTSVQTTGAGQVSQSAEDAVYKVNDKPYTSDSNKVTIGDKKDVTLMLKEVTSASITLSVQHDRSQILDKVESLVDRFNRFESLLDSTSLPLSTDFRRSLQKISNDARAQFETLGIETMADGSLELDEQKLAEKLDKQFQQVQSAISGSNGFATKLAKLAERVEQTPVINMYQSPNNRFNPYNQYLLPNVFLQQASSTGLYLNTIM